MAGKQERHGLSGEQVAQQRQKYGRNVLAEQKKTPFAIKILRIISEPMFLLLIAAAIIYFLLGNPKDAVLMFIFVVGVIGVDTVQEWKTDKALNQLKDLSAPQVMVIRGGEKARIRSEELVPGDLMMIEEGSRIPADGFVLEASDLRVNESSLTGEAEAVWKRIAWSKEKSGDDYWRDDYVYTGTNVITGSGLILVDRIGSATEYGKIGRHLASHVAAKTPLQNQIDRLIKYAALLAVILCFFVTIITYFRTSGPDPMQRFIDSILAGVTLAMAMIPEEFPVILTVFLSMGAWRLAKKQSLIRNLPSVETMGAVSVLCVDKTGTITENQMKVIEVRASGDSETRLTRIMGMASEPETYDPMETAILNYAQSKGLTRKELFSGQLIKEYPFTAELKMMGHVWKQGNTVTIAVKGSPESVLSLTTLSKEEQDAIGSEMADMAARGLRVLGIASADVNDSAEIPEKITDLRLHFDGLIGLEDPPRKGIRDDIRQCESAGIRVIMITGDNGVTAGAIAGQVGIHNHDRFLTGKQIDQLSDDELKAAAASISIFSRVTPEHKLRIVRALKANGEVVAMTGDGVNDAPALKFADIGIAMGKRGSEVSREAANMILLDDNFRTIVNTIKDGRRIYDNIRKAIEYVFVIHIPIALSALAGPFLGIPQAALFLLPVQVVLLELVIDPTCSIVLERQPAEKGIMSRGPRRTSENILDRNLLIKSLFQGLAVFLASFGTYYLMLGRSDGSGELARSMGMTVLVFANLFLVLVNSSHTAAAWKSLRIYVEDRNDRMVWIILGLTVLILIVLIYSPLSSFFNLTALSAGQFVISIVIAMASTLWFDLIKLAKKAVH